MEPLTAFAPRRLLEFRLFEPGSFVVQDATVLFVDIAGFTPLTDRLGAVGSRGTEYLSQLLRRFFGAVFDIVMDRGGDPIAFGGDALTILFDGPADQALHTASDSAAEIQRLARETAAADTPVGVVSLQIRVGIARGSVTSATAASARRSTPVHLGPGLDLAVVAESQAQAGEILIHPSASPLRHRKEPAKGPMVVHRPDQTGPDRPAALAGLVHPVALGRLAHGHASLESHRSISVAFARFPPVSPEGLSDFLALVGALLEIVGAGGGEVVQVAGGDKGMVAMVVFGAPVSHSDDPLRAVQTMLDLRRLERTTATGVATGPVFAALLGSERRRFPAHSGQAVNIAARLMQSAAPGQLLTETATWRAGYRHLRQDGPSVLRTVKGRDEPVEVRAVAGWRRGTRRPEGSADSPIVGRQHELARIEQFLDDVTTGAGRLLTLTGEPGIGKSRLVREAVQRATIRGVRLVFVDAEGHPVGRSTALWRELVGDLTGTPARASSKVWLKGLTEFLPDANGQVAVLGQLLGLRLGAAGAAHALPPHLAAELAQDLVARVVKRAATTSPVLVVIENVHRLDPVSLRLTEHLARALPGSSAGVLATSRTGEDAQRIRVGDSLRLAGLTDPAVAQLAADTWRASGGGTPPPWLPSAAGHRAGGNPLFVRIITQLVRKQWQPGDPPPSEALAAESLSGLIAERVDQLPVLAHQILNVLAVAHRPCTVDETTAFVSDDVDPQTVTSTASELAAESFIRADTDDAGVRFRLQHELLRRMVYERLSHQERDNLHRHFATYLAEFGADPIEVAEHVNRLDDSAMGRRWFPLAADSARRSWNFAGAADWWRRALPLLSGPARESAQVSLLEVLLVAGKANEVLSAADDMAPSRGLASGVLLRKELRARFSHAVAEAAYICGDFDRSEAAAAEAMRLTDGVDEPRHQRAAELLVLGHCARGRFSQAIHLAEQQLQRAESIADVRARATAHASLGAALLLAAKAPSAVAHYDRALADANAVEDVVVQIHVLSDLAGCFFEMRRYADCARLLAEARAKADTIGYRRHLAFNLSNEAQLRVAVGDDHATSCAAAAVRRSLEMGDLMAAANALHTWVAARPATAADPDLWRRLRAVDIDLGRTSVAAEDTADLAVASARRANTAEALTWAAEARTMGEESEQPYVVRRATFARIIADARSSQPADSVARNRLLAELAALTQHEDVSDVEQAEIGIERWRLTHTSADHEAAATRLRKAYAAEPSAQVRQWFNTIGEQPPTPPPALPPPVGIGRHQTTRADLMDAFDRLEEASAHARFE